jgi:hypothetical protein
MKNFSNDLKKLRYTNVLKNNLLIELHSKLNNISEDKIKEDKRRFYDLTRLENNHKYDLISKIKYNKFFYSSNVKYIKDIKNYSLLIKRRYKDISLIQILKILLYNHKINTYDYKNSIKRINKKERIKPKVKDRINMYLKSINKSIKDKSINTHFKKGFVFIEKNNLRYKVLLKKGIYNKIKTFDFINYTETLKEEFSILYTNQNKLD